MKYAHINFLPPLAVASAAERGLALRREYGRGGTAVGVARARDLSNGVNLSPSTVRRMLSFFQRHQHDRLDLRDPPSNGYIAWLLWGGDAGWRWAEKVVAQMNAAD